MSGSNLSMGLAVFQHRHLENKALAEVSIRSFRILQTSSTHIERLIPNLKGLVPNLKGLVPNLKGLVPNLNGLVPNLNGLVPNLNGLVPNLNGLVPNLSGLVSNLEGLSPNLGGLAPHLEGLSPNLTKLPLELAEMVANLGLRAKPKASRDAIIALCNYSSMSKREIARLLNRREDTIGDFIKELVAEKRLELVYPEVPNHPDQRYRTVAEGGDA